MFWTALHCSLWPIFLSSEQLTAHLEFFSTKYEVTLRGSIKIAQLLCKTCTNDWQPGHLLKQKHCLLIMILRPNFFRKETRIGGCWFENLLSHRRIVEDCNIFNKLELELLAGCVLTCNRSMSKLVSTLHITSPKMADMVEMLQGSMWSLLHFTWASFIFHFQLVKVWDEATTAIRSMLGMRRH